MALFQQSSKPYRKAFPIINSKGHNALSAPFTIAPMKSIILSSLLAVVGCVLLSVVVALLAAPSNLDKEEFKTSSPPAVAGSERMAG